MKCPNCQFENNPDTKFCVKCGKPLSDQTAQGEVPTNQVSSRVTSQTVPPTQNGAQPINNRSPWIMAFGSILIAGPLAAIPVFLIWRSSWEKSTKVIATVAAIIISIILSLVFGVAKGKF